MSDLPPVMTGNDINDNDKLMALLAYIISVLVPIVILISESMKVRQYQKYHAINSLGLSVAQAVILIVWCICISIATAVTAGLAGCLSPLILVIYIPNIYYAYLAYAKPSYFEIPVVTQFMRQQGWLKV